MIFTAAVLQPPCLRSQTVSAAACLPGQLNLLMHLGLLLLATTMTDLHWLKIIGELVGTSVVLVYDTAE